MTIGDSINRYNRQYSPYMGNLVNHLPMGQLALYQMTKEVDQADEYAQFFTERFSIEPINKNNNPASSLEECVGQRARYADCLPVTEKMIREQGIKAAVATVLNEYMSGMSSGLFHVLIRLAYAVEGAELEKILDEEVSRALSYYVTGYRKSGLLTRKISSADIIDEMNKLKNHSGIIQLLNKQPSVGRKLKALYESDVYDEQGFILRGSEKDKSAGLLDLAVPAFIQSNNIVVLHCITGLHALLNLTPYFSDFQKALDVYFTCCLSHLLTVDDLTFNDRPLKNPDKTEIGWDELFSRGSQSRDVHTLKFIYTCHQLETRHGFDQSSLKEAALFRIQKD